VPARRASFGLADYEAIRPTPNAFVILPGHEKLEFERVVEDANDRFMLVEKVALVDEADLRRQPFLPQHRQVEHPTWTATSV
jgi:hypothetical protein